MPLIYHAIPTTDVVDAQRILYPDSNKHLTLDDSAFSVMEDYLEKRPLVIDGSLPVVDAKNFMKSAHISLYMVINEAGKMTGIITLKDILGKKSAAKAHEMGMNLSDIQIQDIAQPVSRLTHIHIKQLRGAKVGDLIKTFSNSGMEHILVIQDDELSGKTAVRGLISATRTARMLNVSFDLNERARSFSDIVHAVHGHFE